MRNKINDVVCVMYHTNSQIKFKMAMLTSSLCDKADAYIPVKGTITAENTGTT